MSSGGSGSGKMTLKDIQAEQERERNTSSQNNNNTFGRRSSGGGSSHNRRGSAGADGGGGGTVSYHRSSSSGGGGGGGGGRRGSNHSRRGSSTADRSNMPLERGCICSLKEKFGFIHCADRPAELFFHYSEVTNIHPDQLQMDDEVEFRVGKSRDNPDKLAALQVSRLSPGTVQWEYEESPGQRFQGLIDRPLMRSGSQNNLSNNNSRRGSNSDNNNNNNNANESSTMEGLIRLLVPAEENPAAASVSDDTKNSANDDNNIGTDDDKNEAQADTMTTADGPKIRFTANDYNPGDGNSSAGGCDGEPTLQRRNSSSSMGSSPNRLYRGDLVEFTLVIEKRTRQKFARNIVLLQSERERNRLAREEQMLSDATLEQGVVVSLKQDFGFLRSNGRCDEVYFHYSHVELPDSNNHDDKNKDDTVDEHELQVGQDMEFLVVTEDVEDRNNSRKQKTSARKVKFLPKGTVQFEKVIAEGVTGTVSIVPRADTGRSPQKEQDPQAMGSIRLSAPLTTTHPKTNTPDETVSKVLLHVSDAPGGIFTCSRGSALGLWIREGDKLLFDVVYDFVDDVYYAKPTKHLVPAGRPLANSESIEEQESTVVNNGTETGEKDTVATDDARTAAVTNNKENNSSNNNNNNGNNKKQKGGNTPGPAVRLIGLCLAGRSEGTIHTIKEAYGFIHFAERPVDVHFKQFELLPDDVQADLRRNMGIAMNNTTKAEMMGFHRLSVGTEVQFDLSVQGTVLTQNQHPHRGANKRVAAPQSNQHERENLKAQRMLILPQGTILQSKTIGLGIKGVITKEDPNQPYAGILDLEEELPQMTLEDRHPLVAKMVDEFLQDEGAESLVFHDIQSPKEEDVISDILEIKGPGKVTFTHIPQVGDSIYPGRLCLRKALNTPSETKSEKQDLEGSNADDAKNEKQDAEMDDSALTPRERSKSPKGGRSKSPKGRNTKKKKALEQKLKPIKTIRFDKSSLSQQAKTDVPPGAGDIILCDVHQIRRTGKVQSENLSVVERKVMDAEEVATLEGVTGVGVVKEVVLASKFGFISVADESASKRELLFFHFASVVDPHPGNQQSQHHQGRNKKGGTGAADAVIHKGDEVKFKIGTEKNGKRVAVDIQIVSVSSGAIPNKVEKNACRGYILVEPTDTKVGSAVKPSRSFNRSREAPPHHNTGGRWDHVKDDDHPKDKLGSKGEGVILLLEDPTNMFAAAVEKSTKGEHNDGKHDDVKAPSSSDGVGKCHLHYQNGAIALHGAGAPTTMDSSTNPRRGDLVSFVKSKNNAQGVRDIRVVTRAAATLVRGRLEHIDHINRTAKYVGTVAGDQKEYDISLKEVVSCDPSQLKNGVEAEGVLHGDSIHGVCRTVDLRLESKLGTGRKERPKLNLTVKKDRAGTIMAQSMMARGPDGTTGFKEGWTTRVSKYAQSNGKGAP